MVRLVSGLCLMIASIGLSYLVLEHLKARGVFNQKVDSEFNVVGISTLVIPAAVDIVNWNLLGVNRPEGVEQCLTLRGVNFLSNTPSIQGIDEFLQRMRVRFNSLHKLQVQVVTTKGSNNLVVIESIAKGSGGDRNSHLALMSSAYKAFALDTIEFMLSSLREQVTIISRMSEIKTITTGNIVGSMSVSDLRTGCENLHQQLIRVQEQITALPELDFQKFPTTYTEKPRRNLVISVMEEFKYFIFLCFLVATFWILGYFVLIKSLWRTFDENQPNS